MKAIDTVVNPTSLTIAKAQAEITWDRAIREGRKEVVEWINEAFNKGITINQMMATNTWQAKLKEWGIKKEG